MFAIDPKDPTPLYAQLERAIRAAIASGRLVAGDRLPTVRQLAVDLKVNANTVAKVFGGLERDGVVETRRGVGTFIRSLPGGAMPSVDRERRLSTLVDRLLADASTLGATVEDVLDHLRGRLPHHD